MLKKIRLFAEVAHRIHLEKHLRAVISYSNR
jgi:hypothetical protein